MRAYAFTSRSRHVLILLGICYISLVFLNVWVFCVRIDVPLELYIALRHTGCFPNYGKGLMAMRIGVSLLPAYILVALTFP